MCQAEAFRFRDPKTVVEGHLVDKAIPTSTKYNNKWFTQNFSLFPFFLSVAMMPVWFYTPYDVKCLNLHILTARGMLQIFGSNWPTLRQKKLVRACPKPRLDLKVTNQCNIDFNFLEQKRGRKFHFIGSLTKWKTFRNSLAVLPALVRFIFTNSLSSFSSLQCWYLRHLFSNRPKNAVASTNLGQGWLLLQSSVDIVEADVEYPLIPDYLKTGVEFVEGLRGEKGHLKQRFGYWQSIISAFQFVLDIIVEGFVTV